MGEHTDDHLPMRIKVTRTRYNLSVVAMWLFLLIDGAALLAIVFLDLPLVGLPFIVLGFVIAGIVISKAGPLRYIDYAWVNVREK